MSAITRFVSLGHMRKPSAFVILVAALLFAVSAAAQVTVLTRATVIDGTGAPPQQDITIVMEKRPHPRHGASAESSNPGRRHRSESRR